jgi:hypothetical protein
MRTRREPSKLDSCIGYTLLVLLCMVFSPAMLYLGISSVNDENNLRSNGAITTARVTDSSVDKENGTDVYHIKYRFSIDGGKTWYSYSDRTGRHDIWCPIAGEHWQVTQETKQVEVLYLRDKPWINRPVDSTIGMFDMWAGVCLGILPWLLCLTIWVIKKYNW